MPIRHHGRGSNYRQEQRIAVLAGSDRQHNRDVLRGVARYARQNTSWILETEPTLRESSVITPMVLDSSGVILTISSAEQLALLRGVGVPFVNLSRIQFDDDVPSVVHDAEAIAQAGFEHFRERGFEQFAYCEIDEHSHLRGEYFERVVASAGYACHAFRIDASTRDHWRDGLDHEALDAWIVGLPKPIGILAHNDIRGRHLSAACRRVQVSVPDEVAILGVDNETPHCELCNPPLSSIATDSVRIGYTAASLLDEIISGRTPPRLTVAIPPVGVVVRHSTDVRATEDHVVSQAVRYIRENACRGIRVHDVLEHVLVSRTSLDQRFRAALGYTPHEEIVRVRLRRAKQLLIETDLTLETIAERTGFRHGEYLGVVFQKSFSQTPGEFRAAMAERRGPL